jgi:hypothetical protein
MNEMTNEPRPARALIWAIGVFGPIAANPVERATRFIEEALELAQSIGVPADRAAAIHARVYARAPGFSTMEIGQAALTLELLAEAIGMNLDASADAELARVRAISNEEWQRRHEAKVRAGIAGVAAPIREPKSDDNTRVLELHAALHHSLQNTDVAIEQIEIFAGEVLTWCREVLTRKDLPPTDREIWQRRADQVALLTESAATAGQEGVKP